MPKYVLFDGKPVSRPWATFLQTARLAGVSFRLNSGHRTLAEQARLYRAWRAGRGPLAAFPSPFAPHIRVGRIDHAIDVQDENLFAPGGGAERLMDWARRHDVNLRRTVPSEAWHLEAPASDLLRFHERHGVPRTLRPRTRGKAVRRARWLLSKIPGYAVPAKVNRGYYGRKMVQSVKRFQKKNGLKPDGIVGPATWRLLERKAKR